MDDAEPEDATHRTIPEPTKRLVRQRCCFGCVVCGMPVFDYDHVIEWSVVQAHDPDNIVLLCPNHHRGKGGKLSQAVLLRCQTTPFNSKRDRTSSYRIEPDTTMRIELGSNYASHSFANGEAEFYVLTILGEHFLTLHNEDGGLSLSFKLTDVNGQILLQADKGELVVSTGVWDYQYVNTRLTIRHALRDVALQIDLGSDHLLVHKGTFVNQDRTGFEVEAPKMVRMWRGAVNATYIGSGAINTVGGWIIRP